jgi:hypothetical protein
MLSETIFCCKCSSIHQPVVFFSLGPLPVGTGDGSIGLIATQEQHLKLSSFCSKLSYHPQIDLSSISPLPVGTGVGNGLTGSNGTLTTFDVPSGILSTHCFFFS